MTLGLTLGGFVACLAGWGCTAIDFTDPGGGGGAGSATGGANGAGGALQSGGAAPSMELCGNGIDDEGDGLVDCQDAECTTFCGEVPAGWTGFANLRADGCMPNETLLSKAYISASGDGACSCTCSGTPSCFFLEVTAYGGADCGGGANTVALTMPCTAVGSPGSDSLQVDSGGVCSGSPSAQLVQPTPTTSAVDLCGAPQGTCVFAAGKQACPPGFPVSLFYESTIVDSRSCSPASCDCNPMCGEATVHQDADCNDVGTALPALSCVNEVGPYRISFDPNVQTCVPSGSATGSGGVSLADPMTVCCR